MCGRESVSQCALGQNRRGQKGTARKTRHERAWLGKCEGGQTPPCWVPSSYLLSSAQELTCGVRPEKWGAEPSGKSMVGAAGGTLVPVWTLTRSE